MRNKIFAFVILVALCATYLQADDDNVISGWSFGGVPALAFNSDLGYQYGAVVNLYNYGDGSKYPDYLYSIYFEWSQYTKGSGLYKIYFDSKYILPQGIRIAADLILSSDKALPFYGFNGYKSDYSADLEDDGEDNYISRVFYRHKRNNFRFTVDFQKPLSHNNLLAAGGFGLLNFDIGPVNIDELNKGKEPADFLPDTVTIFDQYVENEWIPEEQKKGGRINYFKLGAVFDTRDNESNPMSGTWSEALLTQSAKLIGSDHSFTVLTITHRQYFTVIPKDLSFAYRIGYQSVIKGEIPFYMLPFYHGTRKLEEGLGGTKTMRGIMKNRVVGKSVALINAELRWKFHRTVVYNQNVYLALNGFLDGGRVVDDYSNDSYNPDVLEGEKESMHLAVGGGFRIAINENFILAADYGIPLNEQDGSGGLYIGLGYLF